LSEIEEEAFAWEVQGVVALIIGCEGGGFGGIFFELFPEAEKIAGGMAFRIEGPDINSWHRWAGIFREKGVDVLGKCGHGEKAEGCVG